MYATVQRTIRGIAIAALSLTGMAAVAPPAQAAFWYPWGIQTNVAASTITSNGWSLCWSGTYDGTANLSDVLSACDLNYIMLTGGVTGSGSYMLAAAGPRSTVFGTTAHNTTSYANGAYFYYNAESMGFAPNSTITQGSADTKDSSLDSYSDGRSTGPYRLSWHTGGTSITGGWRVGLSDMLNGDTGYVRAIYESNGVAAPSINTQPSSQTKDVGQSVSFATSASSPDGGTISYQWQRYVSGAWADISGANSGTYAISSVALSDATSYRANVTNTLGGYSTTSPTNTVTLTVNRLTPTALTITSTTGTYGTDVTLSSTGGASNSSTTTYAVTNSGTAGCSITGTTLSFTSAGTCTVTASKAADSTYAAVDSSATTITIAKAAQAALAVTSDTATYGVGITLATTGGSGSGSVTYTVTDGGSAGCSVTGNSLSSIGAGTCTVSATKATDSRYLATTSASETMTILRASQATLTISTTLGTYGSSLTLATTGGSGTGAVTFAVNDSGTALCSASDTTLTAGHAGTCTVTATKAADGAYLVKSSTTTTITFAKAAQSPLSVTTTSGTFGTTLSLGTTGGSGTGTTLFAVTDTGTALCSVLGSTLSNGHAGTCQVTAVKLADGNYEASSDVVTITIAKAVQETLTVTNTTAIPGVALTLTTSGGSGAGAVTFTVANAGATGCTITSGELSSTGPGTCSIYAVKATDTDYLATQSANVGILVSKLTQETLTVTSVNSTFLETLTLTTSGGSGTGSVTYNVTESGTAGCTVLAGVLSFAGAGTCQVTATKATDALYLARSSVATTITIAKAEQQTLVAIGGGVTVLDALTLHTSGGSGTGAVTYRVSSGTHCAINGDVLRSSKAIPCSVIATKASDANYLAVDSAPLLVSPGWRLVVITAPSETVNLGSAPDLKATQLGLVSGDRLGEIVLQYQGKTVLGQDFGPSTVAPVAAGTYTVSVKSFTLLAHDPDIYTVETRNGEYTIHWVPLPLTDPALAGLPLGVNRPGTLESDAPTVAFSSAGVTVTDAHWTLEVLGTSQNLSGVRLVTNPDGRITIIGTGFDPLTAIRVFIMSTPTELGSVWTGADGAFSLDVSMPALLATGEHLLQINGYSVEGTIRTTSIPVQSFAIRSLSTRIGFRGASSTLTTSARGALSAALHRVPSTARSARVVVTATAIRGSVASRRLAQWRAMTTAKRIAAQFAEHGVDVGYLVKVRVLKSANPKLQRTVVSNIRW